MFSAISGATDEFPCSGTVGEAARRSLTLFVRGLKSTCAPGSLAKQGHWLCSQGSQLCPPASQLKRCWGMQLPGVLTTPPYRVGLSVSGRGRTEKAHFRQLPNLPEQAFWSVGARSHSLQQRRHGSALLPGRGQTGLQGQQHVPSGAQARQTGALLHSLVRLHHRPTGLC